MTNYSWSSWSQNKKENCQQLWFFSFKQHGGGYLPNKTASTGAYCFWTSTKTNLLIWSSSSASLQSGATVKWPTIHPKIQILGWCRSILKTPTMESHKQTNFWTDEVTKSKNPKDPLQQLISIKLENCKSIRWPETRFLNLHQRSLFYEPNS